MARNDDVKKNFPQSKRHRREWLAFMRMVRYGINNFSRNAWLTIAATAVMTITLLIIFMTMAARSTLLSTVDAIRSKVDMSIYVKTDTPGEAVDAIMSDLRQLKTVKAVSYVSSDKAREDFAQQNSSDAKTLDALQEATNKFPGTIHVNLIDINETTELSNFVASNQTLKDHIDPDRPPSFAGTRRTAIERIGTWVDFADKAGLSASIVFIAISSLIVFNTIRMAIFNRREEIQMMKLIGADRNFIRGPFVVEAVVYGFIAAVIATALGIGGLYASKNTLTSYQVSIQPTIDFLITYIGFVLIGMIFIGALIGVISALLATRRYLKI